MARGQKSMYSDEPQGLEGDLSLNEEQPISRTRTKKSGGTTAKRRSATTGGAARSTKRSAAAKKGWQTRRKNQSKRSGRAGRGAGKSTTRRGSR
jgi:hypothetical protein